MGEPALVRCSEFYPIIQFFAQSCYREAVNRPISVSDSQLTRSPTGSVRTMLSVDSRSSTTSIGSRSTVFVPPLNSIPDIADFTSESSPLTRHLSFVSSHHTGTVDDTVIHNDGYVYPGDRRVIAPSRGNSLRRTGSMTDMDSEFNTALDRARGGPSSKGKMRQFFDYSPVSVSSGSSLGKDVFITPPPSTGRGSDRARSEVSDENFFSASSSVLRSNVSSTYYSQTEWTGTGTGTMTQTGYGTSGPTTTFTQSSATQVIPSTTSYRDSDSTSYLGDSHDDSVTFSGTSSSTLSRARAVTRRVRGGSRSDTSTYTAESEGKENGQPSSSAYTPSATLSPPYTLGSSTYTPGSGTRTIGSSTQGSGSYTGTYTPSSNTYSGTGSYTPTTQTGSHTPGSQTESYTASGSGSYTPGSRTEGYTVSASGSYTPSGSGSYTDSYTPGSGTGTASASTTTGYTPGSLTYGPGSSTPGSVPYTSTYPSSSPISNSFTPGTETGYDICLSSGFTQHDSGSTFSETITPPARSVASDAASDVALQKLRVVSQASSEYLTAEAIGSDVSSPASFKSLSTIPSLPDTEFVTADGASTTYKTASEPPTETEYHTASQMPTPYEVVPPLMPEPGFEPEYRFEPEHEEIPSDSVQSSPILSSIGLFEDRSMLGIPTPSEIPSIRSPQSSLDLLPEEVPLPPSVRSLSQMPSFPSPTESYHIPTPSPMPTPTLASESRPALSSDIELLSSHPETEESLESESVLTPSTFEHSSDGTPQTPALVPEVESEHLASTPTTLSSTLPSSSDVPTPSPLPVSSPSSLPISSPRSTPQSTPWARETSLSYDSSVLRPSPTVRSVIIADMPEASYDTSFLRPSASSASSVSSFDRLSTIPPSPSPLTSLVAASPLPSITPVPTLPPSESLQSDVSTPSSLSFSSETFSVARSPAHPPAVMVPRTPSELTSSFMTESDLDSSVLDYSSLADTAEEQEMEEVEREVEVPQPEEEFGSPSTEPSLLSTPPASVYNRSVSLLHLK